MRLRFLRHAFLAAALALVPACQEQGGAAPQVQLVTTSCAGTSPLEGVTHLRLKVTGEGLSGPIERVTPVLLQPEDIPAVPAGPRRMLEVRGYTGEPTSAGRVVSVGRSGPFDMPESGAPEAPVRVILRRVETFVPVEDAQQPGNCLGLTEERAGHTATLLEDGRVLLAGGFRISEEGAVETLASIEILDPMARTFTFVPDPGGDAARRAFHTAARTIDGRVALMGGETQSGTASTPLRSVAVFNPATREVQRFEMAQARSRHASAIDISGRGLVVGGVGEGGAVVTNPEGVDPAAGRSFPVPTPVPRTGVSVTVLADGQRMAVVGGSDGAQVSREVQVFAFNGTTFAPTPESQLLRQGRRNAATALYDDGKRLLVTGGYMDAVPTTEGITRPVAVSEILNLEAGSTSASVGPSIVGRGDLCAVSLPEGRVFTVGGQRPGEGGLVSTGLAELITPTQNVTGGVLGMSPVEPPRSLHTCTALPDGSVLVTGGLDNNGGSTRVAPGAFIFMPVPRD
ncbi:Kelch repeat-containing protein [Hyalangium rubrum]|uniref:Kelch repeat-containing protein n=1 Tax=Hyalangium rubrum TaxID=3103134 RepID=A0ABU5HIN5_9BACT|nr:kelch repeat-containing protein [Hyalangium sp. s54d21]MDY7233315.1 kelch repeat-containing protein [Hyalangium sp. s54d21]